MTAIYRPVLISSAEQAEALPEATVAFSGFDFVRERCDGGWTAGDGERLWDNSAMVGYVALVPIEVEEIQIPHLMSDHTTTAYRVKEQA